MLFKDIAQHDAVDQKRRRRAERNDVGQRVKFAPERTFIAAQPGDAAVQQVEEAGQDDEKNGVADDVVEIRGGDVRLDDPRQREKAAEEVAGGQQIGQQINFEPGGLGFGRGRLAGLHRHKSFTIAPQ